MNQPPSPESEKRSLLQRLVNKLNSPKKLTGGLVAIAALGSLGYWGTQVLVKKKLPPFLENQIGKIIERPIDLGEVKGFSLNSIEFGKTVIPPTTADPDKVTVDGVKVSFNIFPVLFRRTLPLDVALVRPDLYLEQEQNGKWIDLDFLQSDPNKKKKAPLVYFDVDLDVEQADITAVPYQQNPLTAMLDGSGRFNQKKAFLNYDLNATIERAKARIKGETKFKTGSTDTKLLVEDLALSDAATLLPISIEINSGTLNANLDINIPSLEKLAEANIKGMVNLQNLTGEATNLNAPISAKSKLNFSGRNAEVKQTQATLGDITARIDGQVSLDSGYNLNLNVLPFQLATLPNNLTRQLPVNLAGEVEAQVKLQGGIKDPKLTGNFNNTQKVTIDQTEFKRINADFSADLSRVVLENVQIIPVAGGNVTAEGTIETKLKQSWASKQPINTGKMPLTLSFKADLPTQKLISPYYQLPQQVTVGNLEVQGQIDGTVNNPKGLVKWNIADANTNNLEDIAGSGELVIANQNLILRDTQITYGDGRVDISADANLNSKQWQASLDTNSLDLRPFFSRFDNPNLNLNRLVIDTARANFNGRLDRLDLAKIQGSADLDLNVNNGDITVNSQINSGKVRVSANTNQIDLNRLLPSFPVPANIRSSQLTASGELQQLLNYAKNPNLSTVDARVDANLDVAEGTVKAIANLKNNQWQANLNANNLSSQLLLDKFASSNLATLKIDNINAQADISGDIQPLINNEVKIPVAVNQFTLDSGVQNVNARGSLTFSDITSNLDVASNLDINANLDFNRLPIDQIVATASQNNQLIAESVNFAGQAAFNGQLQGQKLLSAPTENLSLTGDLRLLNFAFDDIDFDPVMTGTLNVQPEQEIALNLRGEQDVIAASAVPCRKSGCKLPYLPTNLEIRQGEDTDRPVIATGSRNGDRFSLNVNNFPLALLNLAPGKAAGIEGALGGTTTGLLDINLFTLAAQGNITVNNPGLGYIQADRFNANFNYDPDGNLAEIVSSSLDLGNSKYTLNAALDLKTGNIDGKLDIPQAYIQDILTTLRWFTVEDVINLFNIPNYAPPAAVRPAPENLVNSSIARMLNQLRKVNSQIQANAAAQKTGSIPTELNIQGQYQGEVILGGTIQTPKTDFRVKGSDWQWQPKSAYPNIIAPLGLVIEESEYISLPKLSIAGNSVATTLDLRDATIQVQDAMLSLNGKLSPEQLNTKFTIANLTVDNIGNFVNIPVDLTGEINSTGTIQGTPNNPQLEGKIAFSNGAFNGNVLPANLAGNFDYDGSKIDFNTTAPDAIQVKASVPYPIIPGQSDRLSADVNLQTEAFVFLDTLTQNYLSWVGGKADARLQANARLDPNREGIIYDLDTQGVVNLDNADITINTPFFSEPFVGTGKITLNNQIVNVETLNGTFANKDLSITGKLPILETVANLDNPLAIDLPPGNIEIEKLYEGGIEGKVIVTGASLKPVIGGKVTLENGKVSIPKNNTPTKENLVVQTKTLSQGNTQKSSPDKSSGLITALNNFQVNFKNFNFGQFPIYEFKLDGDLTLNGTIDQPSNILPEGTLILDRANVDLFSTNFKLARYRENTIVFTPDAGVFNPTLDLVLNTQVQNIKDQQFNTLLSVEANSNEIPIPLSDTNNSETVRVSLAVDGEAQEILPSLGQTTSPNCNIRPNNEPLVETQKSYTAAELNRFTKCFNKATYEAVSQGDTIASQSNIINSPIIELTSVPSFNRGEIVQLLSDQFLTFAKNIGTQTQTQLFSLGVNKFVIEPFLSNVLYQVEDTTVNFGKKIGLDYLSLYPDLEAVYKINSNSSVRSTYNYILKEGRIEYQRSF